MTVCLQVYNFRVYQAVTELMVHLEVAEKKVYLVHLVQEEEMEHSVHQDLWVKRVIVVSKGCLG